MIEIPESSLYHVWTKARCVRNPGHGGIGIVFLNNVEDKVAEYSAAVDYGTNNSMEYLAIIKAFELLKDERQGCDVNFHVNSQLVVNQLWGKYSIRGEEILELKERLDSERLFFENVRYFEASKNESWTKYSKELARGACRE